MSPGQYVAVLFTLALGAALQGVVGFGGNLVAVPVLAIVDPSLVPGPLIAANLGLNIAMIRREPWAGAWSEARWPILGQVPGTIAGAAVLAAASTRNLTLLFGALTLVAVAVSAARITVPRTPRTLTVAGVLSGFMGTASGIGGPPVALLYQRADGPEIRAGISRFFVVSSASSVAVLAAFGRFDLLTLGRGAVLVPGTAAGYAASGWLRSRFERRHVRRAVLGLSTSSALVALVHALQ